ncbi:MAG: aminopeptidase P family protein [Acidimicrobiales bacterium]|nr:aminopeptidase P family protein [Acidimicrobiales bacterium]
MASERFDRVRRAMAADGVDVLLLSVGPDLPWLTGYEAMPLERLTMLVVPCDGDATLVVPRLEAPRVAERPDDFGLRPWGETEDPVAIVADLAGAPAVAAIGDHTWSRFLVDLQTRLPEGTTWRPGSAVTGPLRARKDADEVAALRAAAEAADRVAAQLQAGDIPLLGRTEAEVSADIGHRLVAEGHARVNFAIVAAGANAASPHHEPGPTVIESGQLVLCDFGGSWPTPSGAGYCSDITRCVSLGEPPPAVAEAYAVLQAAQAAAVSAATVGTPCEAVDAAARVPIVEAGFGDRFIHRTGHGIGVEEHEDPYIVEGNGTALAAGHAFSVEPGIYTTGSWGMRLEDIVVATDSGPDPLNRADHDLVVVDA